METTNCTLIPILADDRASIEEGECTMTYTTLTVTNDFHNTFVRLRVRDGRINRYQLRRAWRTLCGINDCMCCDALGARGPQEHEHEICQSQQGEMYARLDRTGREKHGTHYQV